MKIDKTLEVPALAGLDAEILTSGETTDSGYWQKGRKSVIMEVWLSRSSEQVSHGNRSIPP